MQRYEIIIIVVLSGFLLFGCTTHPAVFDTAPPPSDVIPSTNQPEKTDPNPKWRAPFTPWPKTPH